MSNIQENPKPSQFPLTQSQSEESIALDKPLRVRSGRGRPQTITHEELIKLTTTSRIRRIRSIPRIPNSLNTQPQNRKDTTPHSKTSNYPSSSNGDKGSVRVIAEYRGVNKGVQVRGSYTTRCVWKGHSTIMSSLRNVGGVCACAVKRLVVSVHAHSLYAYTVKCLTTKHSHRQQISSNPTTTKKVTQIVHRKTRCPHLGWLLNYGLNWELGLNFE